MRASPTSRTKRSARGPFWKIARRAFRLGGLARGAALSCIARRPDFFASGGGGEARDAVDDLDEGVGLERLGKKPRAHGLEMVHGVLAEENRADEQDAV